LLKIAVAVLFAMTGTSSSSNPHKSIPPTAAFAAACEGLSSPTPACSTAALENIDFARAVEGLKPMTLPAKFSSLSLDEQLVVVTNSERSARGLRPVTQKAAYDDLAQVGADHNADPIGPAGRDWGSNWAGGVADPLAADYLWMYDDGPDSPNGDCPEAGAPGCWGHRDNILDAGWTSMGAGHHQASLTELFVQ